MFILHATLHSLVRFTPARTAAYWARYTEHEGACVCINRPGGPGLRREPLNPYGMLYSSGHRDRLIDLIHKADVIHCHDDGYPTRLSKDPRKVLVYQAHIGDIPVRLFRANRVKYFAPVKHACITNGYGRHFDKEAQRSKVPWGRLADVIDIEHPLYRPNYSSRTNERLRVVFTYSNTRAPGSKINAKCPDHTRALVQGVKGVEFHWVTGVSFEESMAVKQAAHVVLDEVFSPYTHLSALEGAAVGACVLTSYDDYTVAELCDYVGAPHESYPFVRVTPQTLAAKIEELREDPQKAVEQGLKARAWIERYYHPRDLLRKYLEFYRAGPDRKHSEALAGAGATV